MIRRLLARGRRSGASPSSPADLGWFREKYDDAVGQIVGFCETCGLTLGGRDIADVGCGEGSMALGLCDRVRPRKLIGFDVVPTDLDDLLSRARTLGLADTLPSELQFKQSDATRIPAAQAEFDFVYSWSAFEHVNDPIGVLDEIRRILRPGGHFFLQLWPFYLSAKGSHLWQWFDQDFHHLLSGDRQIVAEVAVSDRQPKSWARYMTDEFERLNRITVDDLQRAVLTAGFDVIRVELLTSPVQLEPALDRYRWSDLATGGIKLLARPRR